MAAASTSGGRTTRRTRGGGGEQSQETQKVNYATRTRRGKKVTNRAAEVVDICSSGSDEDNEEEGGGEKVVAVEEKDEQVKLEEEDEEEEDTWGGGCRTIIDFESDDSLANSTVKTFLKDCYLHPKIMCHKQFKFVRDFVGEVTGISFQLPVGAPYLMDHEDDTICVDKGDDYLNDLKARLTPPDPDDYDEDDDEVPPYYWATITPHSKKSDLSLMVFKWVLQPMTLPFLELYIRFCRTKYVPPKPPSPPPPPPKPSRRRKGKRGRKPIKKKTDPSSPPGADKVEVVASSSSPPNLKEDNGVDVYITDFVAVFDLSRNMEVEERLQGDIEAKRVRKEENKEEPKSSKELAYLMQANKKNFNTMSSSCFSTLNSSSRKPTTNGWSKSTDDSSLSDESSSSSSSGSSFNSEYRGKYTVGGMRRPYRRKVKKKVKYNNVSGNSTKTSIKAVAQLVVTGESSKGSAVNKVADEIKVNGVIAATKTISSGSSASGKSESGSSAWGRISTGSSSSGSMTPPKTPQRNGLAPRVTPSKSPKITCDICRPSKMFAGWRYLFRHIKKYHGSRKRELMTCGCGRKVRKERFAFHQRYCSKSVGNGGGK